MHELAVTQSIIEACSEHAGASRVLRVTLEVGALSCVMPDALRFCFQVASEGTTLEGAELEILHISAHSRCRACGREVAMHDWLDACTCGSSDLEPPRGGDRLRIKSMEVEAKTLEVS